MKAREKASAPSRSVASKNRTIGKPAGAAPNMPVLPSSRELAPGSRYLLPHESLSMPSVQNGAVVHSWGMFGQSDLSHVIAELKAKSIEVADGKMRTVEALLFDQAMALQTIFTNLSVKASQSEHLSQLEPLLRMALKAQNQSRMTLETLAVVKQGPAVFARQANINNGGQQQVNNGGTATGITPAARSAAAPTELLEAIEHGERMDAGAARSASGADQRLAAVGTVDRTSDGRRQVTQRSEPISRRTSKGAAVADARTQRSPHGASRGARSPGAMKSPAKVGATKAER